MTKFKCSINEDFFIKMDAYYCIESFTKSVRQRTGLKPNAEESKIRLDRILLSLIGSICP